MREQPEMARPEARAPEREAAMKFGLDRLAAAFVGNQPLPELPAGVLDRLRHGRLGVITNPSAVDRNLRTAPEALQAAGATLAALFGPEHGVRGDAPDGEAVASTVDARTGVPCLSLYGDQRRPTPEMLAGLDALLFDVQDVGARFYTFESTLSLAMEAAAEVELPLVVLDRPNPIGGLAVEGPVLEPGCRSFVGLHPVPVRHGCTLGELALFIHARCGIGAVPHVVRVEGWRRREQWTDLAAPWVPPSPNMPTPDTALVYPGMAFLEGTNISEGRGTTRPFEFFGAPWLQAETLAETLNAAGLPGCRFRPQRFRPAASKHAGEACEGVQLHVLHREAFAPVRTGVVVLAALRDLAGDRFAWRRWPDGMYAIDRLAGTTRLREGLDAGRSAVDLAASWAAEASAFQASKQGLELYG